MRTKQNLHQQAADRTRLKILDAARSLFVRQGFSGTSIGALAKAAEINQSLIYHYFENKEDLWRQVKQELIASLAGDEFLHEAPPIKTVDEMIEHLIIMRFQIYYKNPDLMRMLLWQALEEDGVNICGTSNRWFTSWLDAVARLQKQKVISNRLSPKEILMFFNSIIWAPFFSPLENEAQDFITKMAKEVKIILET
jgi:AcrR family transcriptional regulator